MKHDVVKMVREKAELSALVGAFSRDFSNLENSMAELLHKVLFFRDLSVVSRVAHAIYFSPEGFGQRQVIVNNAVKEWLVEHPIGRYDFLSLWKGIDGRLTTFRRTRNVIAHGSVQSLLIGGGVYVRVVPPTYMPELGNLVAKGTIPGRSIDEMKRVNGGLSAAIMCVDNMARVIEYHEEEEPTWGETYKALQFHLNSLNNWFPDAQKHASP